MRDIEIDLLIEVLNNCKRKGANFVQLQGTIMCEETGNEIISTTENQI